MLIAQNYHFVLLFPVFFSFYDFQRAMRLKSLHPLLLFCARLIAAQCLETCSFQVLDSMRLGGGRQDDRRVFSLLLI